MQPINKTHVYGIDVSHHQGLIDWLKVKAQGTVKAPDGSVHPITTVLIKATEGTSYSDELFRRNAGGADAAGFIAGYYHYAHPERNSAADEAANFIKTVKGQPGKFWYVLDVEGDAKKVPSDKLTKWCLDWLSIVEKQTGHSVAIYTGASFAETYLGKELRKYPLWVAHYGTSNPMDNDTWDKWSMFQFTDSGKVAGIPSNNVDLNAVEVSALPKEQPKNDYTGHWAESAIERVVAGGLLLGDGKGEFRPDAPMTRAEMATLLCRLADKGIIKF